MASNSSKPTGAYWRRTRKLTWILLWVWFAITFCTAFFAREISEFRLLGWSFSYFSHYMAAQGAIFIYVIIVAVYAWCMSRLDDTLEAGDDNEK